MCFVYFHIILIFLISNSSGLNYYTVPCTVLYYPLSVRSLSRISKGFHIIMKGRVINLLQFQIPVPGTVPGEKLNEVSGDGLGVLVNILEGTVPHSTVRACSLSA